MLTKYIWLNSVHLPLADIIFFQFFEYTSPFCGVTDTPGLDF